MKSITWTGYFISTRHFRQDIPIVKRFPFPVISLFVTLVLASCSQTGCGHLSKADFTTPPDMFKPWCYWWWLNGNVDEETIDKDLESMKELGFGGLLMVDSRGYWDDDDHVILPEPQMEFMSDEWLDYVCYAIRKADRLGLEFTMNLSSSGGSFKGPWNLGEDSPKRLMFRMYDSPGPFEAPDLPHFKDVAVLAIRTAEKLEPSEAWQAAGDGAFSMSAGQSISLDGARQSGRIMALEVRDITAQEAVPSEGNWYYLRLGSSTIPGFEHDVDILDPGAVERHIRRIMEPLKERLGDLVGKTLTHCYSVSWEGAVPTWSPCFEADFEKFEGYALRPLLPLLAGFDMDGVDYDSFIRDYRESRNDMFRENFYGTMRSLVHGYGMKMYSENGGPWRRNPEVFRMADQLEYLSLDDMPQGEFWHDSGNYWHLRGAASAAHAYGLKRASAESFTNMRFHWSEYPFILKPDADMAIVDGVNHFVWHTFTCSPDRLGVPGGEYFAGTHINRNVTWQKDAGGMVGYLSRLEYMMQSGEPVVDIAVWGGDNVYQNWGHYSEGLYDGADFNVPEGYKADLVNDELLLGHMRVENGRIVLDSGMSYTALALDPAEEMTPEEADAIDALEKAGAVILRDASSIPFLPDLEGGLPFAHRRTSREDIYFVMGEGSHTLTLRSAGNAQLWDAVSGEVYRLTSSATSDGRTTVTVDLPANGSAFIVIGSEEKATSSLRPAPAQVQTVEGPWNVSFSYHEGIRATPPSERVWQDLENLSEDSDIQIRYFSGDVMLETAFNSDKDCDVLLNLGDVVGGLAHVWLNGEDCGAVWTAPWKACGKVREGANTLKVRFTNTWHNRLIGDCMMEESERVTSSNLHYFQKKREVTPAGWSPTIYSGYTAEDKLLDNGILGPVTLEYYY